MDEVDQAAAVGTGDVVEGGHLLAEIFLNVWLWVMIIRKKCGVEGGREGLKWFMVHG